LTTATLIARNLTRRRQRTLLTVLAVGACLFLFTSLITVLETLGSIVERSREHLRVAVHSRTSLAVPMPISYQARLERIPGVEAVMAMTLCLGFGKSDSFLVAAGAVDPEDYEKVMYEQTPGPEVLARFRRERTAALAARQVFAQERLAEGDRYSVRVLHRPATTLDLKLVGSPLQTLNPTTIFFHRKYWTELSGEDDVNLFFLKVRRLEEVPAIVEAVEGEFASDPVMVDAEPEHAMVSNFLVSQSTILSLVQGVGVLVLISITLVVGNTMAMATRERTHEVGILKALGFTTPRVLAMLVAEATGLTLAGGTLGCAAAWLVLSSGFSAGYGPLAALTVRASTVLLGLGASLAIGIAAGTLPAWRAARRPVVASLRRVV
jgi:putative ABC transport system permease protein